MILSDIQRHLAVTSILRCDFFYTVVHQLMKSELT